MYLGLAPIVNKHNTKHVVALIQSVEQALSQQLAELIFDMARLPFVFPKCLY